MLCVCAWLYAKTLRHFKFIVTRKYSHCFFSVLLILRKMELIRPVVLIWLLLRKEWFYWIHRYMWTVKLPIRCTVAHTARVYSSFCSILRLWAFLFILHVRDMSPSQGYSPRFYKETMLWHDKVPNTDLDIWWKLVEWKSHCPLDKCYQK